MVSGLRQGRKGHSHSIDETSLRRLCITHEVSGASASFVLSVCPKVAVFRFRVFLTHCKMASALQKAKIWQRAITGASNNRCLQPILTLTWHTYAYYRSCTFTMGIVVPSRNTLNVCENRVEFGASSLSCSNSCLTHSKIATIRMKER